MPGGHLVEFGFVRIGDGIHFKVRSSAAGFGPHREHAALALLGAAGWANGAGDVGFDLIPLFFECLGLGVR